MYLDVTNYCHVCHGHLMNKKDYENYGNDIDLKCQCNKNSKHL